MCDVPEGGFHLVRGENIVLMAELDPALEAIEDNSSRAMAGLMVRGDWEKVGVQHTRIY